MAMKLLAVMIAGLLALPNLANADDVDVDVELLNPPSGPVYVQANNPQPRPDDHQKAKNRELRRALMQQFDKNGDGRLGPRERMRAVRVLGRIQRKLAGQAGQLGQHGRAGQRGAMRERFIERFDTNRDGTVDRSEMPPGAARKLRRFDQDRDGWVEPNELR